MKLGLIIVIALIVSVFAAHQLLQDPGYVAISFRGYLIEMSVPVLIALFVGLLVTIWLIIKIVRAPRKLGEAAGRYRSGRAGRRLTQGMIEVAEGNFAKGEKLLARSADISDAPLLNYLQAARAAHLLGDGERRDGWLRQAYEQTPEATNAVLLTQAELQLDQQQYEQALATLRRIEDGSPNHGRALNLLGRLYYKLEDWDHLAEVLPKIRKHGRVDEQTLRKWAIRVRCERFRNASDGEAVVQARKDLPKELKNETEVLESYFAALMRTGMNDLAVRELAAELKKDWRAELVRQFGMVEASDPTRQLKKAENWLKTHDDDPDLMLAAARLCLRNELWGKARSYLETVIAMRPTPEAYQEYGRLLNHLGENEAASIAYQDGLAMAAGTTRPAIPHLQSGEPENVSRVPTETLVVGAGYTGARVLAGLDPRAASAVGRSRVADTRTIEFDLDDGSCEHPPPADGFSVVYTVPPPRQGDADPRIERFIEWLGRAPDRLIYISTSGVYGDCDGRLVDEAATPAPGNARSRRRLAAEQALATYARDRDTRVVILRTPAIYGPDRLGLERIRAGTPVIRQDEASPGNRVHVDDLAACCLTALSDDIKPGIYNISDGDHRSSTWFTHSVADMSGLDRVPEISRAEASTQFSAGRLSFINESRRLDNSKMLEKLRPALSYPDPVEGIRASL